MASCKDCVHVDVCNSRVPDPNNERLICENFTDRSRFVELPCKVGDTLYFNNVNLRNAKVIAIYVDASGGMFDLDIATNVETVAGYEHFINKDYTFEDIGKRLFLTKEAAKQALKEREENAN